MNLTLALLRDQALWFLTEFAFRIIRRLRIILKGNRYFNQGRNSSDSDATPYSKSITIMLVNKKSFSKFRRKMAYREILEHLSYQDGKRYLDRIQSLVKGEEATVLIELNRRNDFFGKPVTFSYGKYGRIAPTTLRYISTALEVANHLRLNPTTSVVEIGCGYGGQAAVLNRMFGIRDYTCFDLPPVLELIERYLAEVSDLEIQRGDLSEKAYKWDLVISNYAFSELRRDLQIRYLENVLLKSASGFMIMNSGLTNKTGRSTGKLTITEIREFLPNLKVVEEIPLTGPDNYVILW